MHTTWTRGQGPIYPTQRESFPHEQCGPFLSSLCYSMLSLLYLFASVVMISRFFLHCVCKNKSRKWKFLGYCLCMYLMQTRIKKEPSKKSMVLCETTMQKCSTTSTRCANCCGPSSIYGARIIKHVLY